MSQSQFQRVHPSTYLLAGVLTLTLFVFLKFPPDTAAAPYPKLPGIPSSSDLRLTSNGQEVPIYTHGAGRFAIVRASGPITLSLETPRGAPLASAVLRPLPRHAQPVIAANDVSFTLNGPGSAVLELDGDSANPLFLFVKPPEAAPARETVTHFFETGKSHALPDGVLKLSQGESVYIEGGAVVRGAIVALGSRKLPVRNVHIFGQGLLMPGEAGQPLWMRNVADSQIEDLVVLNTGGWSVRLFEVNDIKLRGLHVFTHGDFSDGIDIMGASDVEVRDCFVRSEDDCVAIKGMKFNFGGNVERISLENLVIWKGQAGNGIEIGYELGVDYIRDISVRRCAIVHAGGKDRPLRRAALSIHNPGRAAVSNVLYEDITIEQAAESIVHLWVGKSDFVKENGPFGSIRDVTFRRVHYVDGPASGSIIDCSAAPEQIRNITFEDCTYLGRPAKSAHDWQLQSNKAAAPAFK
jgi:hypothetical protein